MPQIAAQLLTAAPAPTNCASDRRAEVAARPISRWLLSVLPASEGLAD
jgi:hypothetical protein